MLYDPKWTNELTVLGFVDWLREQDPNIRYVYVDPDNCIICHYMRSMLKFKKPCISSVFGYGERDNDLVTRKKYDHILDEIACGDKRESTYGEALARAKTLFAE